MSDQVVVVNQPVTNVTVTDTVTNVTVATVGLQGPAGSTTVFYTHTQNTPSAVWTINHNLNGNPTAVVMDSAGTMCEGAFSYPSLNQMVINFNSAFSGVAYII